MESSFRWWWQEKKEVGEEKDRRIGREGGREGGGEGGREGGREGWKREMVTDGEERW